MLEGEGPLQIHLGERVERWEEGREEGSNGESEKEDNGNEMKRIAHAPFKGVYPLSAPSFIFKTLWPL